MPLLLFIAIPFFTNVELLLLLCLPFSATVLASPAITFPLSAQYLPIATVGQDFRFQFAPTTFTSADGTRLTYRIQKAPPWLTLDSKSRVFSGTPLSGNVGTVTVELIASDGTGSTRMQFTLLVANSSNIQAPADISGQLMKYGALSGAQTLSYTTGVSFNIVFERDTFTGPPGMTYDATSVNNSPLPSWVDFNPQTLSFSGLTPPLIAIPQTFGIRLIATTVQGYTGASVTFFLVINDRRLVFKPFMRVVNITKGERIAYTALMGELMLDGSPIAENEIASATANKPEWLHFESRTLELSGVPPPDAESQNVSVGVSDIYQDHADAIVQLRATSSLFVKEIGDIRATVGTRFKYTINRDIFSTRGLSVSVNLGDAASWLHFSATTLTLHGRVPNRLHPEVIKARITATSSLTSDSQTFMIRVVKSQMSETTTSKTSETRSVSGTSLKTSISTSSPTQFLHAAPDKLSENSKIGIAVGLALTFLILLVALLWWYRGKRRGSGRLPASRTLFPQLKPKKSKGPKGAPTDEENLEKSESMHALRSRSPPPQLQFKVTKQQMKSTGSNTNQLFDEATMAQTNRSNFATETIPSHEPDDSLNDSLRTSFRSFEEVQIGKKRKRRSSHRSHRKSGLPAERVLTGLGHGRASNKSLNSLRFGNPRASWRESGSWNTTSTGSELSARGHIDGFPSAPRTSKNAILESVPEDSRKQTIRNVSDAASGGAQNEHVIDHRPLEEKRQSYVRRRASTSRSNVIFGSGVGETPSESSSKRSRLAQRSTLYRSRSSSVGVGITAHLTTKVIPARREPVSGTLDEIETADGSSTYSQGRDEGEQAEDGDVSMIEVLQEGPDGQSNRWSRRLVSRTNFRWARGAAVAPEPTPELQSTAKLRQVEVTDSDRAQSQSALEVGARATTEPQTTSGAKAQRLDSMGKATSDASSFGGSARFL